VLLPSNGKVGWLVKMAFIAYGLTTLQQHLARRRPSALIQLRQGELYAAIKAQHDIEDAHRHSLDPSDEWSAESQDCWMYAMPLISQRC
jgi:hypothetical protein